MLHSSGLLWNQPDWRSQVDSWIQKELQQQGISQIGEATQFHIRPWSTVLRVPTNAGEGDFKAVIPDLSYEAALTSALFSWFPQRVPQVLAADTARGWLLMMDGGARLRELMRTTEDIQHWEVLLPIYATLQQDSASHVDELLNMGVCDRRLARLPSEFEELLSNSEALSLHHPDGLNANEYTQLQNCVEIITRLCEELEAFRISETLDHGDLHDGNIFLLNGNYRFFDWGDSGITHPFFSFHRIYSNLKQRFELEADSDWFKRLKTVYLQQWTESKPPEQLEAAFDVAQKLAPIPAALRWLPALSSMDAAARDEYAWAMPKLMRELMNAILDDRA